MLNILAPILMALLLPLAVHSLENVQLDPVINVGDLITDIQHAPNDPDRLFVVTRSGTIHILRDFKTAPTIDPVSAMA